MPLKASGARFGDFSIVNGLPRIFHNAIKFNQVAQHGGRRIGAGRKRGSLTKRTREIAEKAVAEGKTPLEVMLANMRHYDAAGQRELAQGCARDAAPFLHPKLAAINPPDGGKSIATADVSDQERAKVLLNFMVRTRVTLKQET